jgi:hypothetical protein
VQHHGDQAVTWFAAKTRTLFVPQMVVLLMCIASRVAMPDAVFAEDVRKLASLNVSIAVFDPGVPTDMSLHRDLQVFPQIREIEAMFLPFVLRETLVRTNEWGAVRVVPQPDVAAELLVSGSILRSDGETLTLQVRVADASGRVWLDKAFAGVVTDSYATGGNGFGLPGYQQLYDEIAVSLQSARAKLGVKALANIVDISLLRYADQLAPSAFGDYLSRSADGMFTLDRLPARDDPMLERIERIRGAEYVITDAVDGKFQELHAEIASIYDLWREYRRKVIGYQAEDARRVQSTKSSAPRGSYEALIILYDNYKLDRITAQEQNSLAVAFGNEVAPKIEAMENRVADLEGWVDSQYLEWYRLLEELFELESGL